MSSVYFIRLDRRRFLAYFSLMWNIATKAPNFTRENAAEMARRATRARVARLDSERAELEAERAANARQPDDDDARKRRVQKQIDLLLGDMERAKSVKVRLACSAALERLWKLVTPTAGVLRPPKRSDRQPMPALVLRKAPQGEQPPA